MKKKSYFKNVSDTIISVNKKAYKYGKIEAYINRKRKTIRLHIPRGKVYFRLINLQWKKECNKLNEVTEEAIKYLKEKNIDTSAISAIS